MCKAFSDPSVDGVARYNALKAATARHKQVSYDCLLGKGVDRHLFALGKWAEREGGGKPEAMPALFTDAGYRTFKDIRLSTSTLASPALQGGGFGPVSRTSYGVGYGTDERGAHFHVMNYTRKEDGTASTTANAAFVEGAESALKDFREAIAAAAKAGAIDKAGGK
jgi:carnitine O-palmitoyltransferase 2